MPSIRYMIQRHRDGSISYWGGGESDGVVFEAGATMRRGDGQDFEGLTFDDFDNYLQTQPGGSGIASFRQVRIASRKMKDRKQKS